MQRWKCGSGWFGFVGKVMGCDRRLPRDSRRPKSVQNAMLQYEWLRTFGRHLCHFHFDILSSVQIVAFLPRKYFT